MLFPGRVFDKLHSPNNTNTSTLVTNTSLWKWTCLMVYKAVVKFKDYTAIKSCQLWIVLWIHELGAPKVGSLRQIFTLAMA